MRIRHHSASSLNSFRENKAEWFKKVFDNLPFKGNINTARGSAFEAGINLLLKQQSFAFDGITDPAKKAIGVLFDQATSAGLPSQDVKPVARELKALFGDKDFIQMFQREFPSIYESTENQKEILMTLDGVELPIKGYIDYLNTNKRVIDDLKTTSKTPTKNSLSYIVQGSIYYEAIRQLTGHEYEVAFNYCVLHNPKTGFPKTKPKKIDPWSFCTVNPDGEIIKCSFVRIPLTREQIEFGLALTKVIAESVELILKNDVNYELIKTLCGPTGNEWSNKHELFQDFYGLDLSAIDGNEGDLYE